MDNHLTIRVPRRLLKAALILTIVGAVIAPIAVSASHTFTDVPDNHVFHDNIAWLADNDVTRGCNPPTNDQFCPNDNVTRGQMAAFMQRLSEGKIVDAATAVAADSATTAATAATAATADDADTLDGLDANHLTRVAYAVADNNALAGDGVETDILETTITAPIDGFLVITASSDVFGAANTLVCGIQVDTDYVLSAERVFVLSAGNTEVDCSTSTVVPVTAGDHTIKFLQPFAVPTGVFYDESALSVLFVPFDGQGNAPTDFTVTSAGGLSGLNR